MTVESENPFLEFWNITLPYALKKLIGLLLLLATVGLISIQAVYYLFAG